MTNDVAPYTIFGLVPSMLIRERFDEPTVAALRRAFWWRYDVAGMGTRRLTGAGLL